MAYANGVAEPIGLVRITATVTLFPGHTERWDMPFSYEWTIRFGEVDQAGIIYYPNLFKAVHDGVEELMIDAGQPFWELVLEDGVGMPIVHAEADYFQPIRYGNVVDVQIEPDVGNASIGFEGEGFIDGERMFTVTEKHVTVDMDSFKSIDVPTDLRAALEAYES